MNFDIQNYLRELLNKVFGFTDFRSGQLEIIQAIISKNNALAVMPTGAGKSLCYQLPAIYTDQMTIVISPFMGFFSKNVP